MDVVRKSRADQRVLSAQDLTLHWSLKISFSSAAKSNITPQTGREAGGAHGRVYVTLK